MLKTRLQRAALILVLERPKQKNKWSPSELVDRRAIQELEAAITDELGEQTIALARQKMAEIVKNRAS